MKSNYGFLMFATCFILWDCNLFSQDTNYVKSPIYKDNIRISSGFVTQHIDLISTAHGKDVVSSVLVPNVSDNIRFGINWHFISLGYTTKISNFYFKPDKFGTTKSNDFSLNFYGRYVGCEMFYR